MNTAACALAASGRLQAVQFCQLTPEIDPARTYRCRQTTSLTAGADISNGWGFGKFRPEAAVRASCPEQSFASRRPASGSASWNALATIID